MSLEVASTSWAYCLPMRISLSSEYQSPNPRPPTLRLPMAFTSLLLPSDLNEFGSSFDLLGILLAHANLALQRVPVTQSAAANLTIADGIYVALATIVLDLAVVGLLHDRRKGCLVFISCA